MFFHKSGPAQRTCATLDEKAGKTVRKRLLLLWSSGDDIYPYQLNVLRLNPNNPETFPSGLMEALALHHDQYILAATNSESIQERLRKQMQADALQASPKGDEDEEGEEGGINSTMSSTSEKDRKKLVESNQEYDPDFLEEVLQFLRLQVCLWGLRRSCWRGADASMVASRSTSPGFVLSPNYIRILFLLWDRVR